MNNIKIEKDIQLIPRMVLNKVMLSRKTITKSSKFKRLAQLSQTQSTSFERIASCVERMYTSIQYINVHHPVIVEEESVQMRLSQLFHRTIVTTLRLRRRVQILIPSINSLSPIHQRLQYNKSV